MSKLDWDKTKNSSKNQTGDWKEYLHVPTKFNSGIYQGKDIGNIIKADPNYIDWILTNQPKGQLTFQIIEYCNTYGI
jgi:hypothetical protein